jgi:hypothetical protein
VTVSVDNGLSNVVVESVEKLYREHALMDVPDYYGEGEENPYEGRVRVIPRKATAYTMIPEGETDSIAMARLLLKGIAKRRKIWEVVCDKHEVNYNQFARVGRIVVLYV